MANQHDIDQWLQKGIAAAKANNLQTARFMLLDVVEQDQTNETAWYWLYQVFDRVDDKRTCLQNLILINPENDWAKEKLLNLLEAAPQLKTNTTGLPQKAKKKSTPAPRPVTLKLITAFWVGISLIFLTGGIISTATWLVARANHQLNNTFIQSLELLVGLGFIFTGLFGLFVAVMLYVRSMAGFYGSVLLALGLLLVGPITSLIVIPPNYVSMICTGGIAGMIVLLTLASQPGFENT